MKSNKVILTFLLVIVTLFVYQQALNTSSVDFSNTVQEEGNRQVQADPGETGGLSKAERVADFLYLYTLLEENYPYFDVLKRRSGYDWLAERDHHIQLIESAITDQEYYGHLNAILKKLQQDHTNIISPEIFYYYKNTYGQVEGVAPWVQVLSEPRAEAAYRYWAELLDMTMTDSLQSHLGISPGDNFQAQILREGKIGYLKLKTFNYGMIEEEGARIYDFLMEMKEYPYLILDIRGNPGGAVDYWRKNIVGLLINHELSVDLITVMRGGSYIRSFMESRYGEQFHPVQQLSRGKDYPEEIFREFEYYYESNLAVAPSNPVGFKGEIYLLVDNGVYSSAEGLAIFAKHTGWATLVGTTTGGDGIGIDPVLASLPHSGLIVRFPGQMGLNPDGTSNEEKKTIPHILISLEEDALEQVLQLLYCQLRP